MSYITLTPDMPAWDTVRERYKAFGLPDAPYSDPDALAVMSDAPGATDCLCMILDGGDGAIWIGSLVGPVTSWAFLAKAGALALAARTPTTRTYRTTMPRNLPAAAQRNAAERFLGGSGPKQLRMTWVRQWNEDGRWLLEGVLADALTRLATVVLPP